MEKWEGSQKENLRKDNAITLLLPSVSIFYPSSGHTQLRLHPSQSCLDYCNIFPTGPLPFQRAPSIPSAHAAKVVFLTQKSDDPVIPLLKIFHHAAIAPLIKVQLLQCGFPKSSCSVSYSCGRGLQAFPVKRPNRKHFSSLKAELSLWQLLNSAIIAGKQPLTVCK